MKKGTLQVQLETEAGRYAARVDSHDYPVPIMEANGGAAVVGRNVLVVPTEGMESMEQGVTVKFALGEIVLSGPLCRAIKIVQDEIDAEARRSKHKRGRLPK